MFVFMPTAMPVVPFISSCGESAGSTTALQYRAFGRKASLAGDLPTRSVASSVSRHSVYR